MRLGTFARAGDAAWRAALFLASDQLVDLADAAQRAEVRIEGHPADIVTWITPHGQERAARVLQAIDAGRIDVERHALDATRIGPPIVRPTKFIAIGRNYMNHVREGQKIWAARGKVIEPPTFPAAFAKYGTAITAHRQPIVLPRGVADVDYELELAVVIGRPAYRVPIEEALSYVAGYTICNDVGARQLQRREMESQIGLTMSKNFPTFAPLGPWMVSADEIADPQSLDIRLTVNGEERQHSNTADMIFSVAQCIAYWSQIGLAPGDLITTGTPAGVALAMPEPARYYLKAGDVVRLTIERIGTLENPVVEEAPA